MAPGKTQRKVQGGTSPTWLAFVSVCVVQLLNPPVLAWLAIITLSQILPTIVKMRRKWNIAAEERSAPMMVSAAR